MDYIQTTYEGQHLESFVHDFYSFLNKLSIELGVQLLMSYGYGGLLICESCW